MELLVMILSQLLIFSIFVGAVLYAQKHHRDKVIKNLQDINRSLQREFVLLRKQNDNIEDRLKNIFVIDQPTPNEATKKEDESIALNEDNPIDLPKDVKIEVEGGDSQVPFQYANNQS